MGLWIDLFLDSITDKHMFYVLSKIKLEKLSAAKYIVWLCQEKSKYTYLILLKFVWNLKCKYVY